MIPYYEWFYNIILSSANSVPVQSLWVAFFTNPIDLNRAVQAGLYENGFGYLTVAPGAAINSAQGISGALFANSVTIPGDGMNVSKLGPEGSGAIKGNISSGRMDMENLTISFLDTNMSFTDYNLRPWTVYASHRSLKEPTIKTTITVMQLAKTGPGSALLPRAIWTFHDACPVNISSEEWNYGGDNVVSRQVEFAYNYYILNAEPFSSTANTVASIVGNTASTQTNQPVEIEKGGLESHGGNQRVRISGNDRTTPDSHPTGQIVETPPDDIIDRAVNIGLDILDGNSNVVIKSDDVITRLRNQGEELLNNAREPQQVVSDVPEHGRGTSQVGHVYKPPVGPNGDDDDHIKRDAPENVKSGSVPTGGNSKTNAKDLADTPLFFPGDGDENQKKVAGRTVGNTLDTPRGISIPSQQVVVEKTGNVSNNIPLQIVTIKKADKIERGDN